MRSKLLVGSFVLFAVLFGVALWWFQTRAFYERLSGPGEVIVRGASLPVAEFEGIDAGTSPLKLRACFRVAEGVAGDALAIFPVAEDATPLVAPGWFDCFDAAAIQAGISDGSIRAVVAEANAPWGFDRLVAVAPDGRGWMWRQMNACGRAKFEGDPLPADCPPPPEG